MESEHAEEGRLAGAGRFKWHTKMNGWMDEALGDGLADGAHGWICSRSARVEQFWPHTS